METDRGSSFKRFCGYKRALEALNLPFAQDLVCNIADHENSWEAAKHMLSGDSAPSAVFAWNDASAFAFQRVYNRMFRHKLPELDIVGFDGREFVPFLDEPFTTVKQPRFEIGRKAAELLLSEEKAENNTLLKPCLIEGDGDHIPFEITGLTIGHDNEMKKERTQR